MNHKAPFFSIKLLNLLLRFDEQGMLQVKYCDFGASLDLDKSNVKSLQQFCNSLPEYVTMGYCHPESYSRSGVSKVISEQYPNLTHAERDGSENR